MSSRGIPIYVVTEGSEGSALSRLSHYGLLPMIVGVVETRKSPEAFTDIIARYRNGSAVAFSVGDQLDRDIVYAHQAGLRTVYFPGEFVPEWLPDLADAKPDYQVVSFNEVADLALAHCDID
jgi:putative hydrolase of the HAD superfamily